MGIGVGGLQFWAVSRHVSSGWFVFFQVPHIASEGQSRVPMSALRR